MRKLRQECQERIVILIVAGSVVTVVVNLGRILCHRSCSCREFPGGVMVSMSPQRIGGKTGEEAGMVIMNPGLLLRRGRKIGEIAVVEAATVVELAPPTMTCSMRLLTLVGDYRAVCAAMGSRSRTDSLERALKFLRMRKSCSEWKSHGFLDFIDSHMFVEVVSIPINAAKGRRRCSCPIP